MSLENPDGGGGSGGDREATGTLIIAGIAAVGGSLTAELTDARDGDVLITIAYQWQELVEGNWINLVGSTAATLTIPDDQSFVGKQVRVVATTTDLLGGTTEFPGQAQTIANDADHIELEATGNLLVTGAALEGGSLTAALNDAADLNGAVTIAYQWQQLVGGIWTDLVGSTAATLSIPDDQSFVGKQVRVVATTTDPFGGTSEFLGDAETIANVDDPGFGSVSIFGQVEEGAVLDISGFLNDPDGSAVAFSFQWQILDGNDWQDIVGANGRLLAIPSDQSYVDKQVRVVTTFTDRFGGTTTILSEPQLVANVEDEATGTLAVIGDAQEGGSLTAALNDLVDEDGAVTTAFQWQEHVGGIWTNLSGQNSATLTIPDDQSFVGKEVRVVATTTDPSGGMTEFPGLAQSIANVDDPASGSIFIEGQAEEGRNLALSFTYEDPDGWVADISFQWQILEGNEWQDIVSGTRGYFLPIPSDQSYVGKQVRVVMTLTDRLGGTTTIPSEPQLVANVEDEATGALDVTGAAEEGGSLTAALNDLVDEDGAVTTAFQWQEHIGGIWTNLAGADSATLGIPGDQSFVGKEVRVVATATDPFGGTTEFLGQAQTIANVDDPGSGYVSIVGQAEEGGELNSSALARDPDGLNNPTFQWQILEGNEWQDIQTDGYLTIPSDQSYVGKQVRVVMTFTDRFGGTTTIPSEPQLIANVEDEATGTLAVTGDAEEGGSLTAALNGLVDEDGAVTTAYQWQSNIGGVWTNLAGADSATLGIPGDQSLVGKEVRVVATTTDPFGGTTEFLGQAQTIVNVNDAPVAANDQASVLEDRSVSGNVLNGGPGADSDADGDILSVIGLRNGGGTQGAAGQALKGSYGTLQLNANGSYSYVADGDILDALPPGRILSDVFTYTISDGNGGTSTATLSLAVTTTNDLVTRTMGSRDIIFKAGNTDDIVNGNKLANEISGGNGSDRLFGLEGNDVLFGENGWDFLFGGLGNDRLSGGNGNDLLVGGAGNDVLIGGEGADVFQFGLTGTSRDSDMITDFASNDRIQLVDGLTVTGHTVQNGSAMLTLSNGGSITLAGFAGFTDPNQLLMPAQDGWWL